MAIRKYKPTSPGRRSMSVSTFEEITKKRPERALIEPLKKHAGRNNAGRITTRHRGGGTKRYYRIIDFKRDKAGVPARIAAIEYDPNRSARIALLFYADGEKRYIIAPLGLKVNDRSTTSSFVGARGRNSAARRARRLSSWPRPSHTLRFGCRRARSVASTWTAWRPSARSATSTTRTSRSARPVAPGISGGARPSVDPS